MIIIFGDEDDKHTSLAILSGSQDTLSTPGLHLLLDGFKGAFLAKLGLPLLLTSFKRSFFATIMRGFAKLGLPHFLNGFRRHFVAKVAQTRLLNCFRLTFFTCH